MHMAYFLHVCSKVTSILRPSLTTHLRVMGWGRGCIEGAICGYTEEGPMTAFRNQEDFPGQEQFKWGLEE